MKNSRAVPSRALPCRQGPHHGLAARGFPRRSVTLDLRLGSNLFSYSLSLSRDCATVSSLLEEVRDFQLSDQGYWESKIQRRLKKEVISGSERVSLGRRLRI